MTPMAFSSSSSLLAVIIAVTVVCSPHSSVLTVAAFAFPTAHSSNKSTIAVAGSAASSSHSRFPSLHSSRRASSSAANDEHTLEPSDREIVVPSVLRRQCATSLLLPLVAGSFWGGMISPSAARASEPTPSNDARLFLEGVVTVKSGSKFERPAAASEGAADASPSSPAIYVTAKPESMGAAPKTLFDAVAGRYGGKSPPVLTARFPVAAADGDAAFPFRFRLTADDLTEEGAYDGAASPDDGARPRTDESKRRYWWEGENLVVSARLDSDGVAATRDPGDLVGRGLAGAGRGGDGGSSPGRYEDEVIIELQGRGLFGKSVTKRN